MTAMTAMTADLLDLWRYAAANCKGGYDQWDGERWHAAEPPPPLTAEDYYSAAAVVNVVEGVPPAAAAVRGRQTVLRALGNSLALLIRHERPFVVDRLELSCENADTAIKVQGRVAVRPPKDGER